MLPEVTVSLSFLYITILAISLHVLLTDNETSSFIFSSKGKCELCSTRFKFAPQYAPGAPDTIPPREVFLRLLRRFGAKWLPFAIRVCFVISLWFVVLPLGTSYIYHSWMVKPSAVVERWEYELIKRDVVGGAVIAIIIVFSFLSLMSFVEFLRFQWGGEGGGDGAAGQRRRNDVRGGAAAGGVDVPIHGEIDNIILPHLWGARDTAFDEPKPISMMLGEEFNPRRSHDGSRSPLQIADGLGPNDADATNFNTSSDFDPAFIMRPNTNDADAENPTNIVSEEDNNELQEDNQNNEPIDEEEDFEAFLRAQEEQDLEQQVDMEAEMPPLPDIAFRQNRPPRDDARFEPQFEPLQPAFGQDQDDPDDAMDVEINLALDELLGLRGPVFAVIRNLLWLLVFNTAYIGIFALLPSSVGVAIYMVSTKLQLLQRTLGALPGFDTVANTLIALNDKSKETNLIFQPSDIGHIGLGYLTLACSVFFVQMVAFFTLRRGPADRPGEDSGRKRLISAIDCCAAIVKVVVLLFIKMLVLPLSLGLCLDVATLPLFNKTVDDRVAFAGDDLFGSLALHWVTGITFMLLVTVSILQLREVAHPDILARVIRPQEPQPDLLGNLLQENAITHTKRIMLSLGIYVALLTLHIWLPSRILLTNGLYKYLPFFQPKYWHVVTPQLQIPLELLLFHLCMLGVLEKYKNNIGWLQHHWLHFLGTVLGITDQILPREVVKFEHIGTLPVFTNADNILKSSFKDEESPKSKSSSPTYQVHPLWSDLLAESDARKRENILQSYLGQSEPQPKSTFEDGQVRRDGKMVLSANSHIRFPSPSSDIKRVVKTLDDSCRLLPTCIGRYRLKQSETQTAISPSSKQPFMMTINPVIEVYQEVTGKLIPRPPEGWDDLGGGGAESQGRWAWDDEHLSKVEASVAARTPFFDKNTKKLVNLPQFIAKMSTLLLVSWMAITLLLIVGLNAPLFIGHFTFHLLRVPGHCFHDPLAFAIGVTFLIPVIGCIAKVTNSKPAGLLSWFRSFKPNESYSKTALLLSFSTQWFIMCPLLLGTIYNNFFVGFVSMVQNDIGEWLVTWGTGTLLLNTWAVMCYFKLFTKRFWADLTAGDVPANADGNQDAAAAALRRRNDAARNNPQQGNNTQDANAAASSWQGEDGAIGRCFTSFFTFAVGWEWDKLDEEAMLRNCVTPICRQLLLAFIAPTVATLLVTSFYNAIAKTGKTVFLESSHRINALFKILAISTSTIQLLASSKAGLQKWFEAAHKIARDDRYLIGEILLNYSGK
jgi:E3 ubiquitin-protein ligase MARCH6